MLAHEAVHFLLLFWNYPGDKHHSPSALASTYSARAHGSVGFVRTSSTGGTYPTQIFHDCQQTDPAIEASRPKSGRNQGANFFCRISPASLRVRLAVAQFHHLPLEKVQRSLR